MSLGARLKEDLAPARKLVKRALTEAQLHVRRRSLPNGAPRVALFPSNQPWDAASNLRTWLVEPELRRLGWRVLVVPEPLSLAQRRRFLALEKPDVIFFQQTRHLLNQPKLYPGLPAVLDADDADYLDPRHHDRIAESARDAATVIGGSKFVAECLGRHNPRAHVLWTSTPKGDGAPKIANEARAPVVAWAHASPLGYHHEADFVQRVMCEVNRRSPCTFWLFGTTEREAHAWFAPIRAAGGSCEAISSLPYPDYLARVAEAAIGLQPVAPEHEFGQGKSFGKLLAYLSGEVAVVASDAVDHPRFFRHGENGMLPAHDASAWADALVTLLDDPARRGALARRGREDFEGRLTTDAFARLLDPILREAAGLPLDAEKERSLARTRLVRPRGATNQDPRANGHAAHGHAANGHATNGSKP